MNHMLLSDLETRRTELMDLRRSNPVMSTLDEVRVCRCCYVVENPDSSEIDCPCGRNDWTYLTIVIIELGLLLDRLHRDNKLCTLEEDCEHCLQAA